jgi:hypothetical protein
LAYIGLYQQRETDMIVIWKKNGLRLRVLAQIIGRQGEDRIQVQKETAEGFHGIFSVRQDELEGLK